MPRCSKCCDGGFMTWDRHNNGKEDCRSGIDETTGIVLCEKGICKTDSDCCSGYCSKNYPGDKVGKCWDTRCGFIKGRKLNTC